MKTKVSESESESENENEIAERGNKRLKEEK